MTARELHPTAPPAAPAGTLPRLGYLDWARGVAAITMIQGHVFHSFTRATDRDDSTYVLSQFFGGMPPAVFLFLVGVTFAFQMHSAERKGTAGRERLRMALQRAGFLLGVAYLFRLQLWAFGLPKSPWTDLLKVDILNCMGLTLAVLSPLALVTARQRVRLCALAGIGIAAASPLASAWDWAGVPVLAQMYLKPDYNYFSFFPWAAFVPFGMSAGSILRVTPRERMERLIEWGALVGFGMILGGQYFGNIPYSLYTKSEFWLDSPALIFVKLGVVLVLLAVAYLWNEYALHDGPSWVKIFGTHSLFVYWVHTEIVYGRWLWMWKEGLSPTRSAVLAALVLGVMLALTWWKAHWRPGGPLWPRPTAPQLAP